MTAAPTKKLPHTQAAYFQLKRMIMDNKIAANAQVLEQELAERLGMSRTPVREALSKLENDGLVEIIPRRGVRILPISSQDMADIYMILTGLESTAAEYVAEKGLSEQQLNLLRKAVDDMDIALKTEDLYGWAAADERFHKLLVELTNNQRLIAMVETLWDQVHRARMITLKLRPKPCQSNFDHRAVVDAIIDRDSTAAFQTHRDHRARSGKILVKLLEELGLNQL